MNVRRFVLPTVLALALVLLGSHHAGAQPVHHHARPAPPEAPLGLLVTHDHAPGAHMLSYRVMVMTMAGTRDGTTTIPARDVLAPDGYAFMVTPEWMRTRMHMLGFMTAPARDLTLMLMVPVVLRSMDHRTRSGSAFTTTSAGLGDPRLTGQYVVARGARHRVLLGLGLGLPLGSIGRRDVTPASAPAKAALPYAMQLGTGTIDLLPRLAVTGASPAAAWGAEVSAVVPVTRNARHYRSGHRFGATAWSARRVTPRLDLGAQLSGVIVRRIRGADPALAEARLMVPTARPDHYGGARLDVGASAEVHVLGAPRMLRWRLDVQRPVYQHVNGLQLAARWHVGVGLHYML